ncbi:MYXO-CTERM sorting domain-containing protein [Haliangium sp.]|uniref:MYXO-CTERM sorting domain-containing protein n=1 Tax=Haliangium sp. TaxID=2663208 RepID=UPI003D13CB53
MVVFALATWTGLAWADLTPAPSGGCCSAAGAVPDPVTAMASVAVGGALLWGARRRR